MLAPYFSKTIYQLVKNESVVLSELYWARSFRSRAQGLIGVTELKDNQGLYIPRCNLIHTFFMKFPIDCVFVDSQGKIRKIHTHVQPGSFAGCWSAKAVIELLAGQTDQKKLKVGDILYVVH